MIIALNLSRKNFFEHDLSGFGMGLTCKTHDSPGVPRASLCSAPNHFFFSRVSDILTA
jgi:hypothetical protein